MPLHAYFHALVFVWANLDMESVLVSECVRYLCLSRLRKSFQKLWQDTFCCKPPREAFNGWLFESLAQSGDERDPLIPFPTTRPSLSLLKHVLLRVPIELKYPSDKSCARSNLEEYLVACEAYLLGQDGELLGKVKYKVLGVVEEGWTRVLEVVREEIYPLVAKNVKDTLLEFEMRLSSCLVETLEERKRLNAFHIEYHREKDLSVAMANEEGGMVQIALDVTSLHEDLKNQTLSYEIHAKRVEKLRSNYDRVVGDSSQGEFEAAVFVMLHRYQTLFGPGGMGSGWHLATPHDVMQVLERDFDVHHECFASPLNSYFDSFCSVFHDTDLCFGSHGSFFCMSFDGGGSFQAGPPYDVSIMQKMVEKMHGCLERCESALSFVCVVPDWENSKPIDDLKASTFNRASFTLGKNEHKYISGFQHFCKQKHLHVQFECATYVCWLQNDLGASMWMLSDSKVESVKKAWMGN